VGGFASATGQYLTAPGNAAFAFTTSNWTVEAWIYPTALNTYNFIYTREASTNATSEIEFNFSSTGQLNCAVFVSSTQYTASTSTGAIVANRWQHVAAVRNGSTVTVYVDGVAGGTTANVSTSSINDPGTSYVPNILNQAPAANRGMQGYCSNFRLAIGVAVYTGAFTPPTSALTATQSAGTNISAITGTQTKLLTFQSNRFIDNSVANSGAGWTLTVNGSLSVQAFSPFNPTASWSAATYGGSGYFDGSGDWINPNTTSANLALGSGDFTIEFWLYTSRGATRQYICDFRNNGSTGTISPVTAPILIWGDDGADANGNWLRYVALSNSTVVANADLLGVTLSTLSNQWNHIAIVRSSGTVYGYLNGVRKNSVADSTNYNVNCSVSVAAAQTGTVNYLGNISDFRIVKGTAVYTGSTYTVPTAPLTAITNTSLLLNFTNAGIYDATSKNDLETVGDAQISNTTAKWGSTSIKFDGTGDYLVTDNSDNILGFGTGDWTIEFWLRLNSTGTQVIFDGRRTSATDVAPLVYYLSGLKYYTAGGDRISGGTLSTGVWYYIAIVKSSGSTRMYIDGTQTGSTYTDGNNYVQQSQRPLIGAEGVSVGANPLNGYIQDFRVTKGVARTITTPTAAFPTL